MHVSAKFYTRLRERVITILEAFSGYCTNLSSPAPSLSAIEQEIAGLIDIYLTTGTVDNVVSSASMMSVTVFYTLKAELDSAIIRSHRARAAAARRRAAAAQPQPLSVPDLSDLSDLSDFSDNSDRSDIADDSRQSEKSERSELSDLSDLSDSSDPSDPSDPSDSSENPSAPLREAPFSPHAPLRTRFGLKFKPSGIRRAHGSRKHFKKK